MNSVEQVKKVAISIWGAALKVSPEKGTFRTFVTFKTADGDKPLMLIGTTHSEFEDGHCYAVLNPDEDLCNDLIAGCGYDSFGLKERVAKRCDLALDVWIDAYKDNKSSLTTVYRARECKPAKFAVR